MNKTILTITAAIAFGTFSGVTLADDALGLGDSGNYGHAHAAANATVQAAQQVPVVRLGEAAAYPAAPQGARVMRSQQAAQAPALAAAPALTGTAYQAN